MVGRVGGCPVSAAATVREATAEAGVLYGADLWSGASQAYGEMVDKHQTSIARAILGVKKSAERAGVLTELGWSNTSLKACKARLSLWWRIGKCESELLQLVERQAKAGLERRLPFQRVSEYNWFRCVRKDVRWLCRKLGATELELRAMPKRRFKREALGALWRQEWDERVSFMRTNPRLQPLAAFLTSTRSADHESTLRWKPAPYLHAVGGGWTGTIKRSEERRASHRDWHD